MGLWGSKKKDDEQKKEENKINAGASGLKEKKDEEVASAPLPTDVSVFEFGSAGAGDEGMTLAGYCPVSDEMEPCRWEVFPSGSANAPQFRIVF